MTTLGLSEAIPVHGLLIVQYPHDIYVKVVCFCVLKSS